MDNNQNEQRVQQTLEFLKGEVEKARTREKRVTNAEEKIQQHIDSLQDELAHAEQKNDKERAAALRSNVSSAERQIRTLRNDIAKNWQKRQLAERSLEIFMRQHWMLESTQLR